jgi:uncharacterized membrane protein YbhN (UPF0104 family)
VSEALIAPSQAHGVTPPRERRPLAIFASSGDGERRRRPADVFALWTGVLIVLASAIDRHHPSQTLNGLTAFLHSLPDWLQTVLGGLVAAGSVYVALVFFLAVVAHDRRGLVRDLLVGAALTLFAVMVVRWIVDGSWPSLKAALDGDGAGFPVARVSFVTALVLIATPHVIRPIRRLGQLSIVVTMVGAVALEFGDAAQTLGAFGVGLGVAAIVHLWFGSPGGAPSVYHIHEAIESVGVRAGKLRPVRHGPPGPLVLHAEDPDGELLVIKVHGRDAADSQLLAKTWRFLWYRDSGPLILSRLQQVEHEAVATFLVNRTGGRTPEVVAMTTTDRGDAVLVLKPPAGLASLVHWDEAHLEDAWRQLASLRAAGVAHGALDATTLEVDGRGDIVVDQLATATVSAAPEHLHRDVAALLTLTAMSTGVDAAVAMGVRSVGRDALDAAVPYIQPAALTPWLRRAAADSKLEFDDLRDTIADHLGADKPDLVQLQRVTVGRVVMTTVTVLGFWFIISRLAGVDFNALWNSIKNATWGWVFIALLTGQLARVAQAVSTIGASEHDLPLGPTVALHFALTFINVAVPATAAKVAVEMRYYQKQGAPRTEALTAGVIDSFSGFLGQILILIITLGFGAASLNFNFSSLSFDLDAGHVLVLALVLVAIGGIALVAIGRLRRWVIDFVRQAIGAIRSLKSARRVLLLFGGNIAGEIVFASTLGFCALAVGYHISLANLLAVNVLVGLFAGLMPLPSVGVTEAAITAGLVAVGMPQADSLAAAILYRCCTFYLPPLWGYVALRWLTKNDYL